MDKKKLFKLIIAFGTAGLIMVLPPEVFGLEGLTVLQQRVLGLFVLAVLMWVTEPIPIFSTSVLIIFLELILLSDKSLIWLRGGGSGQGVAPQGFGEAMSYREIMATSGSPLILLFLGGYFLAMAATKYRLDMNLARVLLRPFGSDPRLVMLGLMAVTAIFSMFMSNTATTAMMLAILTPVLAGLDADDPGNRAFVLSIPFAANVGGMGTPIGTPPNAVALKYLTDDLRITFGEWMAFGIPYVLVLLLITWVLLVIIYPPRAKQLTVKIDGVFQKGWKAYTVYVTFALTVLLWLTGKVHGLNSYIIAMLPVTVFTTTGIITAADLKRLSWDVLWLVSGGIALGLAMQQTGLSSLLVEHIPFEQFSALLIVLAATLLTTFMATFMSNTATANLLMPIMAALGVNVASLESLGGVKMLIVGVAFASSLAMALPVSTPPNAMAHATGRIESRHMLAPGLIVGFIGLLLTYAMLFLLNKLGFFGAS